MIVPLVGIGVAFWVGVARGVAEEASVGEGEVVGWADVSSGGGSGLPPPHAVSVQATATNDASPNENRTLTPLLCPNQRPRPHAPDREQRNGP